MTPAASRARPSQHIRGPEPLRSRRLLLMLKAYIDDSGVGQPPISILAGWVAQGEKWAVFSDEWQQALEMRPRLAYFKMSEAHSFSGEFNGWTIESRNERVRFLISIIERCGPLGISVALPYADHQRLQQEQWYKDFELPKSPYPMLFFGLISVLTRYYYQIGSREKVDFIFDDQPEQMEKVMLAYRSLLAIVPPGERQIFGDAPIFRNEKSTLPLQAADLKAGFQRRDVTNYFAGRKSEQPPWGDIESGLLSMDVLFTAEILNEWVGILTGSIKPKPSRFTRLARFFGKR